MSDAAATNRALIERFYTAFAAKDAAAMGACYSDAATFNDPAFGRLTATEARAMWTMLIGRSTTLRVEFRDVVADDASGSAHWEAWYDFSGRPVHNVIDARFTFRDGLIVEHLDTFDFAAWAGQALGLPGKLLGRTGFLRRATTKKARAQLTAYLASH